MRARLAQQEVLRFELAIVDGKVRVLSGCFDKFTVDVPSAARDGQGSTLHPSKRTR